MIKPAVVTRIREEMGLSPPALSKLLGGAENLVWRWEHGKAKPSAANAQLLEIVLAQHRARSQRRSWKRDGSEIA